MRDPRMPFREARNSNMRFLMLACVLAGCFGTETENPEVGLQGRLVNVEGIPVIGAKVKISSVTSGIEGAADSALTDAAGNFVFRDLEPNNYNLLGDYLNGTLMVLIPDVALTRSDSSKDVGTDTLRTPGSIRARVFFQGNPLPDFYAYLSRTSFTSRSDSGGYLNFTRIPQGKYELVYYAQNLGLPYNHRDSVEVISGRASELPPKVLDSLPDFSATPI